MNYYEHHLGDWAAATGHLTWDEDMAYTRLLRAYYHAEKPIQEGQQYRLARAIAPAQRKAVDSVLAEFFTKEDDGWHQKRADQEIAAFKAGEPDRELKKRNEDARLKRHREERARLFQVLADNDRHAPWNVGMNELRAIAKSCGQPLPATAPATPATATHTQTPYPDTIPNTKDKSEVLRPPSARAGEGPDPEDLGETLDGEDAAKTPSGAVLACQARVVATSSVAAILDRSIPVCEAYSTPTPAGSACLAIRGAGIPDVNPGHPGLLRLLQAGVTAEDLAATASELVGRRKGKFALLLATVEGRIRDAAEPLPAVGSARSDAWREDDLQTRAMAAQLGVRCKPGELYDAWSVRIVTAWRRAGEPALQQRTEEHAA